LTYVTALCKTHNRITEIIVPEDPTLHAVDELLARNRLYAERHQSGQTVLPRLRTCIVTCPDPRVDPARVLGVELGDAAVIRAAGGRISPIVLQNLLFLQAVGAAAGAGDGLELVLMPHTDCGIARLQVPESMERLAAFLGCTVDELDGRSVGDPYGAVRVDIAALAANPAIPDSLSVTGLVYDVETGRAELVERRSPLRQAAIV
jgi:carbonic anhydrase